MPLKLSQVVCFLYGTLREAFQTKKRGNFGPGPSKEGGGRQKSKKIPIFSWEKFKKVCKSKKFQVPEGSETEK